MNSNALIILLIAIVILWLAVTDKLSRFLDAYDVITGEKTAAAAATAAVSQGATVFHLPNLPPLMTNAQVPA